MDESWMPSGFHTVTPNIIVEDADAAITFLKRALGATERYRLTMSNGKIAHCELAVGDSIMNLGEAMDGWPARGLVAQIYVEDSDALFERAVAAGASVIMAMTDMFFGAREGRVCDPFGNIWTIATPTEPVSPERDATQDARRLLSARPRLEQSCSHGAWIRSRAAFVVA